MSEWKECKLGELIEYKKGFAFKSSNYTNVGVLIVRVSDTTDISININSCVRIKIEEASLYKDLRIIY